MNAEQQQGGMHLGDSATGGTREPAAAPPQTFTALDSQRALTDQLMEQVCDPKNLVRAYRRVRANKGKPGVDGMTVQELADWLRENHAALTASLLSTSPPVKKALSNQWFSQQGFVSLVPRYDALRH